MSQDRTHHTGLYALSFAEFWERISFLGTIAILVLYGVQTLGLSLSHAYTLYSIFIIFSYGGSLISGIVADKYLGDFHSIVVGTLFMALGNALLFLERPHLLYAALTITILGSCMCKTSCLAMVGILYDAQHTLRQKGFTFLYTVMNIGAVLGPLIYGIIAKIAVWRYCFLFTSIGLLSSTILLLCLHKRYRVTTNTAKQYLTGYAVLCITGLFCVFAYYNPTTFKHILPVLALCMVVPLATSTLTHRHTNRMDVLKIVLLCAFCACFFAASLQVGSSIIMLVKHHVHKTILGTAIPTVCFTALDPFFVIASAPFFTMLWLRLRRKQREPSTYTKVAFGLMIITIGFLVFYATLSARDTYTLIYVIFGYAAIGAGEMCLAPPALAFISQHSPDHMRNTMMSIWFVAIACAGYIGGILAQNTPQHAFMHTAILTGSAALSLYLLTRLRYVTQR